MSRCVLKTTQTCSTFAGFATTASPALASVAVVCTSISENSVPVRPAFGCRGERVRCSANSRCRNSPELAASVADEHAVLAIPLRAGLVRARVHVGDLRPAGQVARVGILRRAAIKRVHLRAARPLIHIPLVPGISRHRRHRLHAAQVNHEIAAVRVGVAQQRLLGQDPGCRWAGPHSPARNRPHPPASNWLPASVTFAPAAMSDFEGRGIVLNVHAGSAGLSCSFLTETSAGVVVASSEETASSANNLRFIIGEFTICSSRPRGA